MKAQEALDYCRDCRCVNSLSQVHAAADLVPFADKDVDDATLETLCKAGVPAEVIRSAVNKRKECPKKCVRCKV